MAPSSFAVKSRNTPPYSPIGVRFPATMTTSFMSPPKTTIMTHHERKQDPAARLRERKSRRARIFAMTDFLSALQERVLVCDGAMGTMLYSKGVFISRCFDELNVSSPELVRDVHLDYVKAGVDIVETNTFGGNRTKLMSHGLADQTSAINTQGARIAREAAGNAVYVAGAIGPLGIRIEPWGK